MDVNRLRRLLEGVRAGQIEIGGALTELAELPFADLDFARVDHHRALRQGIPEVVFAEGKTNEQVVAIARELASKGHGVLITRLSKPQAALLQAELPELSYNAVARTAQSVVSSASHRAESRVVVATAGTSDLPVAEEALETLRACGVRGERINDVGVAGLHRLLPEIERLRTADVVIVVAGMEGALASVVGGLVASPVIAVPTSVGYGAAFEGVAALLGMLTSCAAGVTVVNIDNGFGAAVASVRMLDRLAARARMEATRASAD
jgi:hypothetical protein